jgi:hypothetical protein
LGKLLGKSCSHLSDHVLGEAGRDTTPIARLPVVPIGSSARVTALVRIWVPIAVRAQAPHEPIVGRARVLAVTARKRRTSGAIQNEIHRESLVPGPHVMI